MNYRHLFFFSNLKHQRLGNTLRASLEKHWQSHLEGSELLVPTINVELNTIDSQSHDAWAHSNWYRFGESHLDGFWRGEDKEIQRLMSLAIPGVQFSHKQTQHSDIASLFNKTLLPVFYRAFELRLIDDQQQLADIDINQLFGCIGATVSINGIVMQFILPHRWVLDNIDIAAPQPTGHKLYSRQNLCTNKQIKAHVEFPAFSTTVGLLSNLEVGQVLDTGISLEQPFILKSDTGTKIAECYVGKNGDKKAIILTGRG